MSTPHSSPAKVAAVSTTAAPAPIGPLSQGIIYNGMAYCSVNVGLDRQPTSDVVDEEGVEYRTVSEKNHPSPLPPPAFTPPCTGWKTDNNGTNPFTHLFLLPIHFIYLSIKTGPMMLTLPAHPPHTDSNPENPLDRASKGREQPGKSHQGECVPDVDGLFGCYESWL
jgi:hypothetical protein